jgi:hypothetical protein
MVARVESIWGQIPPTSANGRPGRIHLGPDSADQRLSGLAAGDVHLVEELRLLAELVHDLTDLGRDGIDGQLEGEPKRVVGRRLQHRHDLGRIDEGEASRKQVDAAAARTGARKLKIERLHALLRETRPDIAERVIAGRLTLIGRGAGHVGSAARVGEEVVHLGRDVGARDPDDGKIERGHHGHRAGGRAEEAAGAPFAMILSHQ